MQDKQWESWRLYERLVARMLADEISTEFCVTPNASIRGVITGVKRQIDVLIEMRHETDNTRRIIVDAKQRKRKIDVRDVENFRGMMEDVGATHGYLVCPRGHTPAAEKRAQTMVSIRLLPLDHLENFDPRTWPACRSPKCSTGRVFWDGYPEFSYSLVDRNGKETRHAFIHFVGKCDRCGMFHVECRTCREILCIPVSENPDDVGHQCACRGAWFWLGSIERDEKGAQSAELHFVWGTGIVETVNRRSISAA